MRMLTDLSAAFHEILRGRLSVGAYLRTFQGPLEFALVVADDPLPGLLAFPLSACSFGKKAFGGAKKGWGSPGERSRNIVRQ